VNDGTETAWCVLNIEPSQTSITHSGGLLASSAYSPDVSMASEDSKKSWQSMQSFYMVDGTDMAYEVWDETIR